MTEQRRILPASTDLRIAPASDEPAGFNETDIGNGLRFVDQHADTVRFCSALGWLVWDGRRWARDDAGQVRELAKKTAVTILIEAAGTKDSTDRKNKTNWAKASESGFRIKAMLDMALSDPAIVVRVGDLDASPYLFNVANGTIDLETGELLDHNPEHLITKLSPVAYDPRCQSDTWDNFLNDSTGRDDELQGFVRRAVGYSLTGVTDEEKFFFVHGPGASGKSTFMEAIKTVLGDYARTANFETFIKSRASGGPSPDIARLAGARLVSSIEVEEGKRLAEGVIKALTGGDTITACFKYKDDFEFVPQFKLWLVANHAPRVNADDSALWRRIDVVPFTHVVPVEDRDPAVKAELRDAGSEAAQAVLAWAVTGYRLWREVGLKPPPAVVRATAAYKDDQDVLGMWIAERCYTADDGESIQAVTSELYSTYRQWCEHNGHHALGRVNFGQRLDERGYAKSARGQPGTNKEMREGIELRLCE